LPNLWVFLLNVHVKLLQSEAFIQHKIQHISLSGWDPPRPTVSTYVGVNFYKVLGSSSPLFKSKAF